MGPPGGGEEDKTPPVLLNVSPESGSINLDPDSKIELIFSEPVDEGTLERAIFISPPQDPPRVSLRGVKAVIRPAGKIPSARPMILTVGSGVKDLHGNAMAGSVTIAVTSGDRIAGGEIAGRIYADEPTSGMLVGAWYAVDTSLVEPDSIPAPFLTQSGTEGFYSLKYLPTRVFKVVAWDDKDGDRLYRAGIDRLALPWINVAVYPDSVAILNLYAFKHDTTVVAPLMILATDNRHLLLRLTKKPDERFQSWMTSLSAATEAGETLEIQTSWIDAADSARIHFLTGEQVEGAKYVVTFSDDTTRFEVSAVAAPDTIGPMIAMTRPAVGDRNVPAVPSGIIAFNDKLVPVDFDSLLTLSVHDSVAVPVDFSFVEPNLLVWNSRATLEPGDRVTLSVDLARISDHAGNAAGDSVWTTYFSIIDPAGTGEIGGKVLPEFGYRAIVASRKVGGFKNPAKLSVVNEDGSYTVAGLEPGEYGVWCWSEHVIDGRYTFGSLRPFQYAEPFKVLNDTITVRARWETGGIDFILP